MAENAVLRRIIPDCIEDTGGLFVTTPDDDPAYGDRFLEGCRAASLPAEEIPVAEALRMEPRLNPGIQRAFTVPDAAIDIWKTVSALARGATAHGARILTYHRVIAIHRARRRGARRARAQRAHRRGARRRGRLHASTPPARGPRSSPRWPRSRASAWSPARGS